MPKLYGSRSVYQSSGWLGLQLMHSTPRDDSSSPNAAVNAGPPSTANGWISSAMRTASARAATSSEAMPLPTKNCEVDRASVQLVELLVVVAHRRQRRFASALVSSLAIAAVM